MSTLVYLSIEDSDEHTITLRVLKRHPDASVFAFEEQNSESMRLTAFALLCELVGETRLARSPFGIRLTEAMKNATGEEPYSLTPDDSLWMLYEIHETVLRDVREEFFAGDESILDGILTADIPSRAEELPHTTYIMRFDDSFDCRSVTPGVTIDTALDVALLEWL